LRLPTSCLLQYSTPVWSTCCWQHSDVCFSGGADNTQHKCKILN
jgi:hypothetical protein